MSGSGWRLGTGFKFKPNKGVGSPPKIEGLFVSHTFSIISNLPHMVIQFWQRVTTVKGFAGVAAVFEGNVFASLMFSLSFCVVHNLTPFIPILLPLPLLSTPLSFSCCFSLPTNSNIPSVFLSLSFSMISRLIPFF